MAASSRSACPVGAVLITLACGAVGLDVWANTIGLMVEEFHWLWATEWLFFSLEVVAGYLFYRYRARLSHGTRMWLLTLYAISSWMSLFLINGIPVLVIECKNANKDEAIALGVDQIRRYHRETPELFVPPSMSLKMSMWAPNGSKVWGTEFPQTIEFASSGFSKDAQKLPVVGLSESPIPPAGVDWREMQPVEALLGKYQREMELLHEASSQGGAARFPTKFEEGFAMLVPHAQQLRGTGNPGKWVLDFMGQHLCHANRGFRG